MTTTTTMPVLSTGWNLCRCQCCVWTLLMMSSLRLMVSPSRVRQNKTSCTILFCFLSRSIHYSLRNLCMWMLCVKYVNALCPLQPFQWRQWSRIPTWPYSLPVMAAILASWRACGLDRALTWTGSSSSLPRRSSSKEADSKTSPDKRTTNSVPLVWLPLAF